jgi:hypothetical protein
MEGSPSWEADSHSATKQIPCLLWSPKFHYRFHKLSQLVHILSLSLTAFIKTRLETSNFYSLGSWVKWLNFSGT